MGHSYCILIASVCQSLPYRLEEETGWAALIYAKKKELVSISHIRGDQKCLHTVERRSGKKWAWTCFRWGEFNVWNWAKQRNWVRGKRGVDKAERWLKGKEELKESERMMERRGEDNCRKGGLLVRHYPQSRDSQTKAVDKWNHVAVSSQNTERESVDKCRWIQQSGKHSFNSAH